MTPPESQPPQLRCPECDRADLVVDSRRKLKRGWWLGCPACKDQFQYFDGALRKVEPE